MQPYSYWHVWVDGAGTTHQSKCEVRDLSPFSLGKGMEPIFIDRLPDTPAHVVIAQSPKGWVGQWHENPAAQWIITLSGHWFVEKMDGHRVEMGPGDVSLGEDQGSKPNTDGHDGHVGYTRRCAPHPDVRTVGSQSDPQRRLLELVRSTVGAGMMYDIESILFRK